MFSFQKQQFCDFTQTLALSKNVAKIFDLMTFFAFVISYATGLVVYEDVVTQ